MPPARDICKRAFAGLGYVFQPALFRNTIVQWQRKLHSFEFKAISQNLGHEHAMTTYNSYGKLNERGSDRGNRQSGQIQHQNDQSLPTRFWQNWRGGQANKMLFYYHNFVFCYLEKD